MYEDMTKTDTDLNFTINKNMKSPILFILAESVGEHKAVGGTVTCVYIGFV